MIYFFGNFKQNMGKQQALEYGKKLDLLLADEKLKDTKICLFLPYTHLDSFCCKSALKGSQDVSKFCCGAYTGEVSAQYLQDCNANYTLIGHSERRKYFGESNNDCKLKITNAIKNNINVCLCVGETLEEYQSKKTFDVIKIELFEALENVNFDKNNLIVAYEPVFAIGSGIVADLLHIEKVCEYIKKVVYDKFYIEIDVLYGGSVNIENKKNILNQKSVDGVLIGNACLSAENFCKIICE